MTDTEKLQEAESDFLEGLGNLHSQVIEANQQAAERLSELSEWAPPAPEGLPDPSEAVKHYYDFAAKLLEANRAFSEQLVATWVPKQPKPKGKTAAK